MGCGGVLSAVHAGRSPRERSLRCPAGPAVSPGPTDLEREFTSFQPELAWSGLLGEQRRAGEAPTPCRIASAPTFRRAADTCPLNLPDARLDVSEPPSRRHAAQPEAWAAPAAEPNAREGDLLVLGLGVSGHIGKAVESSTACSETLDERREGQRLQTVVAVRYGSY